MVLNITDLTQHRQMEERTLGLLESIHSSDSPICLRIATMLTEELVMAIWDHRFIDNHDDWANFRMDCHGTHDVQLLAVWTVHTPCDQPSRQGTKKGRFWNIKD